MSRPRKRVAPVPTEAVCEVCEQTVPLVDVVADPGWAGEYTGRFVPHERVVTAGKPPRPCPMTGYTSNPERYDTEDD